MALGINAVEIDCRRAARSENHIRSLDSDELCLVGAFRIDGEDAASASLVGKYLYRLKSVENGDSLALDRSLEHLGHSP